MQLLLWLEERFTPTGVGTACPLSSPPARDTVHPHRRGDGLPSAAVTTPVIGSPPQAWGRRLNTAVFDGNLRFTPTGVGTAFVVETVLPATTVHPHRRGDGSLSAVVTTPVIGSPPQAWGRHAHSFLRRWQGRFTPTGVGTASYAANASRASSVHPHRRGDGPMPGAVAAKLLGSPPQAWGRH